MDPASLICATASATSSSDAPGGGRARSTAWAAFAACAALLLLKIACAFRYRIDSDEPQHLHTVWRWANGYIPYRDFFDNHSPLFQALCAPLFALFGERADIVILMRLAMIPLFFLMLLCVYRLATRFHSRRAGYWAAGLTALSPTFFLVSGEFRTDNLWTLSWLVLLVLLTGGPLTTGRLFACGVLLGATFGVSMKTSLLTATFLLAATVAVGINRFLVPRPRAATKGSSGWNTLPLKGIALVTGAAIVPALLALFFYRNGAWDAMNYCVFHHNVVPGLVEADDVSPLLRPLFFPVLAPLAALAAAWLLRTAPGSRPHLWTAIVWMTSIFYLAALWGYWPIHSAENYEPFYPLFFAGAVPFAFHAASRVSLPWGRLILPLTALALGIALLKCAHPWVDQTEKEIRLVADALALTRPDEFVMAGKCEAIYRRVPYYYVLETMTDARLERGLLKDTIAKSLVATKTPLVRVMRLPKESLAFVRDNYIPILNSDYRVAGQGLKSLSAEAPARFTVKVPATYLITDREGIIPGMLNGTPLESSRWLEPGEYEFLPSRPSPDAKLIWERAYTLGYAAFKEKSAKKRR